MQMHFYPAGGAGYILSMVLGTPALHKAHTDGAHLGELVDGLEAVVDGLSQQLGELLVVEDLQAAATGDLTDGGGVEAMMVVAVSALYENAGVAEALGVDLSADIVEVHAFADVPAGVLDGGVAVDVGEQAQAEAVLVVGGVSEAVHEHAGGGGVVGFAHAVV